MEEKFYSNLFDIIDDRSKKGLYLSSNDLNTIISIYNERFYTDDYISEIKDFKFEKEDHYGSYTPSLGLIRIDRDKIKKKTPLNGVLGANIDTLHTMLHELQHARQMRIINETSFTHKDSDLELYLLIYAYFYLKYTKINKDVKFNAWDIKTLTNIGINPYSLELANDIKKYMSSCYTINPAERMAEIKALYQIKVMLLKNGYYYDQMNIIDGKINRQLVRGYTKGEKDLCYNSPSFTFLRKLKLNEELYTLQKLIFAHKQELNNSKRLYLGIHADEEVIKGLAKSRNKN